MHLCRSTVKRLLSVVKVARCRSGSMRVESACGNSSHRGIPAFLNFLWRLHSEHAHVLQLLNSLLVKFHEVFLRFLLFLKRELDVAIIK